MNADRLSLLAQLIQRGQDFVAQVYLPDVLAIASFYKDWAGIGSGLGNYMAYGDYASDIHNLPETFFLPGGLILGKDLSRVLPINQNRVAEYVTHSWYNVQLSARGQRLAASLEGRNRAELYGSAAALRISQY